MPLAPHPAPGQHAVGWAQAVAKTYEPLRAMLAASYVRDERPGIPPGVWRSEASLPFVAAVDACSSESDSMLRWAAFASLAYGARGVYWVGAGACAPIGSMKFGLLSSINRRLAQWGNTFVASTGASEFGNGGYNITRLWSSGYALPSAVPPGAGGPSDLVQSADEDVLVAELGSMGRPATPLLYVVDQRVSATPGAARARALRVRLRADVSATQPVEGDCAASRCQCGLSQLGSTIDIQLPGGAGQLVALAMAK